MKIGIMGTHGVGKSRFALDIASSTKNDRPGKQLGLVSEVARDCPFPVNEGVSDTAQHWIYHMQMIREIEAATKNDILICDRTILDSLAYSKRAGFFDLLEDYLSPAVGWMATYDEVYFLRPDTDPADDGFRSTDPKFQKDIDTILADWVKIFGLTVAQVMIGKD